MNSAFLRIVLYLIVIVLIFEKMPGAKELVADRFDSRPAVTVLFIGNSRTEQNNMPAMVRTIADSAHSPKRYDIKIYTPGGSRMEDHWNDPKVHDLLARKWDYVVLQGQSGEQLNPQSEASFQNYGTQLIRLSQGSGTKVVLFVSWRYADADPLYTQWPYYKDLLHGMIQGSYGELARNTGSQAVNVGRVWEKLRLAAPGMNLYHDTNHPSIYGSYLTALMFYQFFSGDSLKNVTYIPDGISAEDATLIKRAAESW